MRRGYEGRVSVGHVTNLSATTPEELEALGKRLVMAGIAVTALAATDLFLMAREFDRLTPRGVAPIHRLPAPGVVTTRSTNNVTNPFTPLGGVSLMRMANLYANIAQIGAPADLEGVFDMIAVTAAKLVGKGRESLEVGAPADLVILDARSSSDAVAEIAPAVTGWKDGRQTFVRPPSQLLRSGRQPKA
jgi:cytosine/creatinine deaminase